MAKIYRNPTVEWYKSQIGYSSGSSKSSKYSKELDSVDFYNSKKNGYANWCAIFFDAGIYENAIDASVSDVRAMVYEPNRDNCGAGCAQKISYYKSRNAWYPHKVKGCPAHLGDEVFFGSSEYKSSTNPLGAYHTGAVIGWDNGGIYTVEGNTNGKGDVSKRYYEYGNSKLLGYGRPDWTADDPSDGDDSKPTPTPTPTPEPTPEPTIKTYTVSVSSYLSARNKPSIDGKELGRLYNGAVVSVIETSGNWAKITGDLWVSMTYLR